MIDMEETSLYLPDILSYLQRMTNLRRKTLLAILTGSGRLADFKTNPQKFMDVVSDIIRAELRHLSVEGIEYERIANEEYEMKLFEEREFSAYLNELLRTRKSVYEQITYDSEIERKFAEELEKKDYIKLFVKLPAWFSIKTPVGEYNPDWAIVKDGEDKVYFIRETKSTLDEEKLRIQEKQKFICGKKHFSAIGMNDVELVKDASEI
jgi:type III restriction enzyme